MFVATERRLEGRGGEGEVEHDIPMAFPRGQLKLGKELGAGDFGKVFQCEAKRLIEGQKKTTVIVKVHEQLARL